MEYILNKIVAADDEVIYELFRKADGMSIGAAMQTSNTNTGVKYGMVIFGEWPDRREGRIFLTLGLAKDFLCYQVPLKLDKVEKKDVEIEEVTNEANKVLLASGLTIAPPRVNKMN